MSLLLRYLLSKQALNVAAVFLGRATGSFVAEHFGVFTFFAGGLKLGFGCVVFEEVGEQGCANAFLGESDDVEGAGECFGARDDGVADAYLCRGFGDLAVVADRGAAAGFGGITACFIHACAPQPFVEAHGGNVGC